MSFEPLTSMEEKEAGRLVSYAVFALWIIMFIMDGIAYSIYYQSEDIRRNLYQRSLLGVQAQIFLAQAISGILWFIVSVYIFYSAMFIEKREKYNVAGGVLFLVSGIAELVLSVYLLEIRQTILDYQTRFPLISREEFIATFMKLQGTLLILANISNMIIMGSIGGAFILIGMSVKKFVNTILQAIQSAKLGGMLFQPEQPTPIIYMQPQEQPISGQEMPQSYIQFQILAYMERGARKMNSGANLYIASGALDIISLLIPGLAMFSFILFIIGAMYINSGQKMVNQARKQLVSIPPSEESPKSKLESGGDNEVQ